MSLARITVIEDDAAIRRGIVDALRFTGYTPIEAEDGETGLQAALQPDTDLVLLDVLLPRMDGFAAVAFAFGSSCAAGDHADGPGNRRGSRARLARRRG